MTSNQLTYWANVEKERANRAQEQISKDVLKENVRHNKAQEAIGWGSISAQRAQIAESRRHSLAMEALQGSAQAEAARHNAANEAETKRHNVTGEVITGFTNLGNFVLGAKKQSLAESELEEKIRHNKYQEGIDTSKEVRNWASSAGSLFSNIFGSQGGK